MKRKNHWLDTFFCTLFILGTLGIFYVLPLEFEILNPLSEAFGDFELTDVVYSRHLGEDENLEHIQDAVAPKDTNIVLVNIGNLDRYGMAEQVNIINAHKPKLIAIDVLFEVPRQPDADSLMADAFSKVDNLILGVKLLKPKSATEALGFDSSQASYAPFMRHAMPAFVNLITDGEEKVRVSRRYSPQELSGDTTMLAFSTKIASIAYPAETKEFLSRNNKIEDINFRRHEQQYIALDIADVFNPNLNINLKDKIVIMGYMGETFKSQSWEDKFITPLNEKYIGKTAPDMFGVTVHANVVSMIHERHYINEMHEIMGYLIGVLWCLLNVSLFLWVNRAAPRWYDAITKAAQFSQILGILYIVVLIFSGLRYKIDLSFAIGAILLAGDLLEIYIGLIKPKIWKWGGKWLNSAEPTSYEDTAELDTTIIS